LVLALGPGRGRGLCLPQSQSARALTPGQCPLRAGQSARDLTRGHRLLLPVGQSAQALALGHLPLPLAGL
jgi:hypothetical protein